MKYSLSETLSMPRLHSSHQRTMRNTVIMVAFLSLGLVLAWAMSPLPGVRGIASYLPLHTLLETIAIVISMLVFAVGWNAYRRELPGNILLLACAFFGVGVLDFTHMLSYTGMPDFITPSGPEKSIDFWLAARSLAAITLFAISVNSWRPLYSAAYRYMLLAAVFILVGCLHWLFLFHGDLLPQTFIPGQGLTPFKIGYEYALIALNLVTAFVLWLRMRKPLSFNAAGLFGAVCTMALSELFFTLYADFTDIYNLLGHIYKVISYLFIYRAIFVAAIEDPYQRLAISQSQMRTTLDALPDLMFELGLDGRYYNYHTPYIDLLTPTGKEFVGRLLQDTFPPNVSKKVMSALQEANETGRSSGKYELEWPQGKRWFEFSVVRKPVGAGQQPRFIVLSRDVSERKRAEEENARLAGRLELATRAAKIGIWDWDIVSNKLVWDNRMFELYGIKKEDFGGAYEAWHAALHPDDSAAVVEAGQRALREARPYDIEFRVCWPNGAIRHIRALGQVVCDEKGTPLRMLGMNYDITERKEAEERLKLLNQELEQRVEQRTAMLLAAKEEAEQASRIKSLFLANISHELRTPLNAILGYAQLMQIDPDLPGHVVENAHEIKRAGDHLLTLMNDILDLARIESGHMEMQISAFELSAVIKECHVQNNSSAAARNIALACDNNCASITVMADRRRLLQVLNNLVSNAIKYNREGGKASITCNIPASDRVRISVIDTGVGIAPEKQVQLFEPFNRLGAEMGTVEGSGIGLVIARRLVESMDGKIGMESTRGSGSTFWVELPVSEKPAAGIKTESLQNRAKDANRFRVLVAEDYVANQIVLRLQLQTLGCEVDIAADGAAALDKWLTGRHDLILTDLNMPVMDGLALVQAVRTEEHNSGGHTPIIAITADALHSELQRCRAAGMDDVLTKPISLEGLRDMLTRWMGDTAKPKVEEPELLEKGQDAILDIGQLYRILGRVSSEQAHKLAATFIRSAREGLDALASKPNDAEAVSREMHKLKSSSRTVGALRFAKLAEALEKQSKESITAGMADSLAELRRALSEVEIAAPGLHLDARSTVAGLHAAREAAIVNCHSVLVVDDDPVVLRQMTDMLATLGVAEVLTASNGREAIELISARSGELEVLVCDLNMPEMDGVELIRKFGQTGFNGGLILMSGADVKVLSTVSKLAGLQGLRVLGQLQKPVMPDQIAELLARPFKTPARKWQSASAPVVTRDDILAGMAGNEFIVWFQPKVDALSLRPAGIEALARWRRPGSVFIQPDIFVTVAEHEGLIGELSKVLVIAALSEGARIFAAGYTLKISINLSGRWLNDLNLPEFMLANTLRFGLRAEDVILEVTETGVMEDLTTALDVLTRLRLKGFGLSIDDFGIGYSSFEQLGRIPFTELKLDRSFVNKAAQDGAALAILEGSMDMARKLGLSTVAEGVETEAELELIRSLGCDWIQGYLIAKAMPLDDLLNWLRGRQWR